MDLYNLKYGARTPNNTRACQSTRKMTNQQMVILSIDRLNVSVNQINQKMNEVINRIANIEVKLDELSDIKNSNMYGNKNICGASFDNPIDLTMDN